MENIVKCAVQGRKHIKNNTPCQDKVFSFSSEKISVVSLADGAGSAKLSHFGAEVVTSFICQYLANNFDRFFFTDNGISIKVEVIEEVIKSLKAKAYDLKCDLKELASTLLVVAVKENKFIISHIGDGVIGYLKGNDLKVISEPDNGEFANETVFTTSSKAIYNMRLFKGTLENISGFVLMSDGSESCLYDKKNKMLANYLKRIFKAMDNHSTKEIEQKVYNDFENIIRNRTNDDCSLIILS